MKQQNKQIHCMILFLILAMLTSLFSNAWTVSAFTAKLSKKVIKVKAGKTVTLKVKYGKKKAHWSVKSGKKYVKIKSKKRYSVKIKAIKKGTARIQCKIGRKRLYCKVKVSSMASKVKPTVKPSAAPVITPICPTHVPTEDRLMAEPVKCTTLPAQREDGTYIWYPWGNFKYYFFGSDIERAGQRIRFMDTNHVPVGAEWSMDVSERQNKSVMAWYADSDGDGEKEINIGQENGVVANPNSSYLFCQLSCEIEGLENFYTTDVTDMSYMFRQCSAVQKLDLGNQFDTSNVENMNGMFYGCGFMNLKELHMGRFFDVSKVKSASLMFEGCGYNDMKCFVIDEKLRSWILDEANSNSGWTKRAGEIIVESF